MAMAFSSSSSRVSSFISSLIVLACLFQRRCHLIKADQSLIDQVCDKTGDIRVYCQLCFRFPDCLKLNIKGLAIYSISCSGTGLFDARRATEDLSNRSTGKVKENCLACLTELDQGAMELTDASNSVQNENKQEGLNILQNVHNRAEHCLNLVGSAVADEFEILKRELEVSTNVVHQIPN